MASECIQADLVGHPFTPRKGPRHLPQGNWACHIMVPLMDLDYASYYSKGLTVITMHK